MTLFLPERGSTKVIFSNYTAGGSGLLSRIDRKRLKKVTEQDHAWHGSDASIVKKLLFFPRVCQNSVYGHHSSRRSKEICGRVNHT